MTEQADKKNLLGKKVALVTGASRGIGKAILHQLAQSGFYVIGTATTESGAEAIKTALTEVGLSGEGHKLNVTDSEQIQTLLSYLKNTCGSPLVLINNAGVTKDNLLMRMSDEEWDAVIDTNLKGVFRLARACVRDMMKARWGRIVNIGSIVGSMGNPGQVNYCAAKAGVMGLSRSLARELASRNITVNVVAPGFIETDMTAVLSDELRENLLKQIPLGRIGKAEEIASVVNFLCSEGASYMTGETLHVNGGMFIA